MREVHVLGREPFRAYFRNGLPEPSKLISNPKRTASRFLFWGLWEVGGSSQTHKFLWQTKE